MSKDNLHEKAIQDVAETNESSSGLGNWEAQLLKQRANQARKKGGRGACVCGGGDGSTYS